MGDKQDKLYVTFRKNEDEKKLYSFVVKESAIGGPSNYFKQLALKDMREKERDREI